MYFAYRSLAPSASMEEAWGDCLAGALSLLEKLEVGAVPEAKAVVVVTMARRGAKLGAMAEVWSR